MTTEAIIIRTNNNIGESDRIVTLLTPDIGVIRASVRGARSVKSRLAASTELLSHSRVVLGHRRDMYIVEDAEPLCIFSRLSKDISSLALAQYLCELAGVLAPRDGYDTLHAPQIFHLLLRALHLLSPQNAETAPKDKRIVKSVVELRMLSCAGFMPDLNSCAVCGRSVQAPARFMLREGRLLCCKCSAAAVHTVEVSPGAMTAMSFSLSAPSRRCFSFSMQSQSLSELAVACEAYTMSQIGRSFKSLEVYHSLKG